MKRLLLMINLCIALFYPVYVGAISGGWLRAVAILTTLLCAALTLIAWSLEANDMAHEAVDNMIISELSTAAINFVPADKQKQAIAAMSGVLMKHYEKVHVVIESQNAAHASQDEPESTEPSEAA